MSFSVVLFESLEEVVCVVGRIVVDNIMRELSVNFFNIFSELAAWFSLDFLDLLETATLHKGSFSFKILGKDFGELGADVGQDIIGS